jgi:pseudaminic acid synthase
MNIKLSFKIGKNSVGDKAKCLIIAEISANHNNNFTTIKKLITSAKKSGADIVKIQTYTADTITINSKKKDFKIKNSNPWSKQKYLWNLYKKAETSNFLTKKIFRFCKKIGVEVFSSPFDIDAVNFLEKLNCPAYKIASPEINHIPLIERISLTKKPIILSLGLAEQKDIELAIKTIKKNGNNKIILLQCVSSYPASIKEQNLKIIPLLKKKFGVLSGLSDHTKGFVAPLTAVALGANAIEKHFNLSNNKSVDSFFSTNEKQFKEMVYYIRMTEEALGTGKIKISKESKINFNSRRSIYVSEDIKKNEVFSKFNIRVVRPNYGLDPKFYNSILGKKSTKNLKKGDRLKFEYAKK